MRGFDIRGFDIYCFDGDSTLWKAEGIDLLAELRGEAVAKEVRALTERAMGSSEAGRPPFEAIYQMRLEQIRPTLQEVLYVADFIKCQRLTPCAKEAIAGLRERKKEVYLATGGIEQMVEPLARELGITGWSAVPLIFGPDGNYKGIVETPMNKEKGKIEIIGRLRKKFPNRTIAFIGDGMTDKQTQPYVDCFIAYTGVIYRPEVVNGADLVLNSLDGLV